MKIMNLLSRWFKEYLCKLPTKNLKPMLNGVNPRPENNKFKGIFL
jgi:hypothetical protein